MIQSRFPRTRFLAILLSAAAWLLACGPTSAKPPLNVVVFVVDDLGYSDVGCYGSAYYETPHIDALAKSGVRFTDAYAACPVCSPTRAALMTGKYPQRVGITDFIGAAQPRKWKAKTSLLPAPYEEQLALDETTVAEAFRDAGYKTFFAGKWHLGKEAFFPEHQGFDVNIGGCEWGHPKGNPDRQYFSPYNNPRMADGPKGEYLTDRLAKETANFIESAGSEPFFAWLSFYSVHTPIMAPDDRVAKYRQRQAPVSEEEWGTEGLRKVRQTQNVPEYAAMVESVDLAVGTVLEQLDRSGVADNTLVIFTSDNGGLSTSEGSPTSNTPLRAGKGWAYEGGIRVPCIMRLPGGQAGVVSSLPVISMDVFPTSLDAAAIEAMPEAHIDGVSVKSELLAEPTEDLASDRALYWHYPHYGNQGGAPFGAVRVGDWKLIEHYETGDLELFNLSDDQAEQHNLVSRHPQKAKELEARLSDWRVEVGAKMPTARPSTSRGVDR